MNDTHSTYLRTESDVAVDSEKRQKTMIQNEKVLIKELIV